MAVKRWPPLTATGVVELVVVPLPSWPTEFHPQQYAAPADVRPQAKLLPAVIEVNRTVLSIANSGGRGTLNTAAPQHRPVPVLRKTHVPAFPATSAGGGSCGTRITSLAHPGPIARNAPARSALIV